MCNFCTFLAQNFKTKVFTAQKNLLLECLGKTCIYVKQILFMFACIKHKFVHIDNTVLRGCTKAQVKHYETLPEYHMDQTLKQTIWGKKVLR